MKTTLKYKLLTSAAIVALGGLSAVAQSGQAGSSPANDRALGNVERADKLMGMEVRNNTGQKLGKIEDAAVELESGRVLYAVVSVGGFLGLGDRLVAVPPGAFTTQGHQLRLDADKQKLTGAPQFEKSDDQASRMLSPSFAALAAKAWGQSAWYDASSPSFNNIHKLSKLMHTEVKNVSNTKIGGVNNAMIDLPAGRVVFVVFEPDPSLEVQNKLYALPPNALTLSADKQSLVTGISRETLTAGPGFDENNWPDFSNPSLAGHIYQYYGKQSYFDSGTSLKPTSGTNAPERIYHEPDSLKKP